VSSGGIAAFTAAWHHPDQCRRVLSHCGSFTDIWGGHNYPSVLRRTPRKPLRVLLQSGAHDVGGVVAGGIGDGRGHGVSPFR
jgi:enterochelin esterase family protein